MRVWWGDSDSDSDSDSDGEEKAVLVERPVQVEFYLQKIQHGISWNRTRISVVAGWRLTHSAIAGPPQISSLHQIYINIQSVPRSKHTASLL